MPLQVRPGSKWGFFNPAGGALGRGTATHYDHSDLTPIANRQAIEINQDVLDQTNDDAKAIRKILSLEVKNAMREIRTQMNAQLQLAGDNILATVSALPGGNVLTLGNGPYYSQMVRAGQVLTIYDTTVTTNRGTCTVQFVDYPNNNVQVDVIPGGTLVGDTVLPEGVAGANPVGYFGIHYHHSDSATGTWMTMSRATNPEIRANHVNNNGAALTLPPIRLLLNKILQRVGQVNPKQLIAHMHSTQKAAYEELAILVTAVEKGSGNEAVDLLFGDIKLAGVPAMVDIHADRARIDFVNLDTWGKVESAPIDFLKQPDGRYFDRPIDAASGSQVAAIIFWVRWFGQFFIDNPAAVGYIDNLALPTGYSNL